MPVDDPGSSSVRLQSTGRQAQVDDAVDEEWMGETWREPFPADHAAGEVLHNVKTLFEEICNAQILSGEEEWGPFASEDEWQLAKWLIKNMGQNQANEFLKLNMVSVVCCWQSFSS